MKMRATLLVTWTVLGGFAFGCGQSDPPTQAPPSSSSAAALSAAAPALQLAPHSPLFHAPNGSPRSTSGRNLGFIPSPVDLTHLRGQQIQWPHPAFGYPSSYDLRTLGKLTAVRDQGDCGACWTFGTYSSLESNMLPGQSADYSEDHMKNSHGFDLGVCAGGNREMSSAYLTRWSGPISEADDPYSDTSTSSPTGLTVRKHVQDILYLPDRASALDNDTIKQAVMTYGAVQTSIYWSDSYYTSSRKSYYYNGSTTPNHAVAIVGWNDSYNKNNFSPAPSGNGAFIIRNSWGPSWGENGYFYISYYDAWVGSFNAVFSAPEETSNYSYVYQYDPLGWVGGVGFGLDTAWMANIFTAQANQSLQSVGFYTASLGSSYQIKVYDGASFTSPIGTSLLATTSGTLPSAGYHTVSLPQPVALLAGHKFSVLVKLTTPNYIYPVAIEEPYPGYSSTALAHAGESFVSYDGATWIDVNGYTNNTNVCLKAYVTQTCDDNNPCTTDTLNGSSCTHTAKPAGTVCRASSGPCDVAETCSGSVCPADSFAPSTTVCRAAAGPCDRAESCSGSSATCPADSFAPSTTVCRPVAGPCDRAESCSGSSVACPTDTFESASTACRTASCSAGIATAATQCSGSSASCPVAVTQSCSPYLCSGTSCAQSCTSSAQCQSGFSCLSGVCQAQRPNGQSCASASQCQSGQCIDGICCNTACSGQCEACDLAGHLGTCSVVTGAPHGIRPGCASDGTACGGACDGVHSNVCAFPGSSTICQGASCSQGIATLEARCSGAGSCVPPSTVNCAPYQCDGSRCAGNCTSDLDCTSGNYCAAGQCSAKVALGQACAQDSQCTSAHCVDGLCCDSACSGQCEACDVSGHGGICSPVAGSPHGPRPTCNSDQSVCGGRCDGTARNQCAYPSAGTVCREGKCIDGTATIEAFCNGAGACPAAQYQTCSPYQCAGNSCAGDCSADQECAADSYCSAGMCKTKSAQGQPCASPNACASGFCVDGFCCNRACSGQCEACDTDGHLGVCSPATGAPHGQRSPCASDRSVCAGQCNGLDVERCSYPGASTSCRTPSCENDVAQTESFCNGAGQCPASQSVDCSPYHCGTSQCQGNCRQDSDCAASNLYCAAGVCREKLANAQACMSATQCQSGYCVDGLCCNQACAGQCQACDVTGHEGSCTAVTSGQPHGARPVCTGLGPCQGSCTGALACTIPGTEKTCGQAYCGGDYFREAPRCDGQGNCAPSSTEICRPYGCSESGCNSECSSDSDCAFGLVCQRQKCVAIADAGTELPEAQSLSDGASEEASANNDELSSSPVYQRAAFGCAVQAPMPWSKAWLLVAAGLLATLRRRRNRASL